VVARQAHHSASSHPPASSSPLHTSDPSRAAPKEQVRPFDRTTWAAEDHEIQPVVEQCSVDQPVAVARSGMGGAIVMVEVGRRQNCRTVVDGAMKEVLGEVEHRLLRVGLVVLGCRSLVRNGCGRRAVLHAKMLTTSLGRPCHDGLVVAVRSLMGDAVVCSAQLQEVVQSRMLDCEIRSCADMVRWECQQHCLDCFHAVVDLP
jgi:hypothetical protein